MQPTGCIRTANCSLYKQLYLITIFISTQLRRIKFQQEEIGMPTDEQLLLLDLWVSPFSTRVKIALAEKGLSYETQEEDVLGGKSDLLLKSNPLYAKVPVLLHNGKPVVESTNIVYYIDETWLSPQLLPACSYGKSRARFWADFIDKKVRLLHTKNKMFLPSCTRCLIFGTIPQIG